MKPLAICGLGPETHDTAPWDDDTWERWGLTWDAYAPRCHFGFDLHDDPELHAKQIPRLQEIGIPVYLAKADPNIPMSLTYPLYEVRSVVGDYFGSTIAYMLALAIYQNRDRVGLFGVDLPSKLNNRESNGTATVIPWPRAKPMRYSRLGRWWS